MFRKRLADEFGYSLVEVMVSIMILTIAIIPMVGMFDMGLNGATTSSNFDAARSFANERLERVKLLSYAQVRDAFPVSSSTPISTGPSAGTYTSSSLSVPASTELPNGATYTVSKRYVILLTNSSTMTNSSTDSGMIRVTITVNWQNGKSITVSGLRTAS